MKNDKGYTLVEVMLAAFLTGVIALVAARLLSLTIPFFQGYFVRSALENDGRIAMSTMTRFIQQGKASSVVTCGCGGAACVTGCLLASSVPPYSQIQFTLASDPGTTYTFYYLNKTVQMQVASAGLGIHQQQLAQNVSTLNFMGYGSDPTIVTITLRLDKVINPNQTESVFFPNQTVHMVGTP